MTNTTIATQVDGHSLVELCKAGGLQDIYQIAVDGSNEVADVETKKGRTRARSLAAQVASSKTLFVKACRGHIQKQKELTLEGEKEIREFIKSMDTLRDNTKQPAIAVEERIQAELDAYAEAWRLQGIKEEAAQNLIDEERAMNYAHMEGVMQNHEFQDIFSDILKAEFHFNNKERNKGKCFDAEAWITVEKMKNNVDHDAIKSIADHINEQRFVIPGTNRHQRPQDEKVKPVTVQPVISGICSYGSGGNNFQQLAAAENLHTELGINMELAGKIINSIVDGKINSVEWVG